MLRVPVLADANDILEELGALFEQSGPSTGGRS